MEEEQPRPPAISLGKSIANVFSSPAEAFEGLGSSASAPILWATTLLISVVFVATFSYIISSNDTFRGQIFDAQSKALQKQVEEGKLTQERADMATDQMQKMGGMFMVIGTVAGTIFVALYYFGGALFLWLAAKVVLKSPVGYGKFLEAYGIANWIGLLGTVITLLLMLGLNTMYATPSAALAIYAQYDPANNMHKIMSTLNVFVLWQTAVLGIGVAKMTGKPTMTGIGLTFVLWIVWVAISFALGFAR
jgi:Yip1 domain